MFRRDIGGQKICLRQQPFRRFKPLCSGNDNVDRCCPSGTTVGNPIACRLCENDMFVRLALGAIKVFAPPRPPPRPVPRNLVQESPGEQNAMHSEHEQNKLNRSTYAISSTKLITSCLISPERSSHPPNTTPCTPKYSLPNPHLRLNRPRRHRPLWTTIERKPRTRRQRTLVHIPDRRTAERRGEGVQAIDERCELIGAHPRDEGCLGDGERRGETDGVSCDLLRGVGAGGQLEGVKGREGVDGALVAADGEDFRDGGGEVEDVGLD